MEHRDRQTWKHIFALILANWMSLDKLCFSKLPHVRGQGQKPEGPHARRAAAKRSYPASEVGGGDWEEIPHAPSPRPGAAGGRSYPTTEARGGGPEDQPHLQGAVAARAQEGLEELSHVEGQEGWQ